MVDSFWETEPGWILWRTSDGGLLPYNAETKVANVIEDDDEAARVNAQMLEDGVPVLDELP